MVQHLLIEKRLQKHTPKQERWKPNQKRLNLITVHDRYHILEEGNKLGDRDKVVRFVLVADEIANNVVDQTALAKVDLAAQEVGVAVVEEDQVARVHAQVGNAWRRDSLKKNNTKSGSEETTCIKWPTLRMARRFR